jgi:hypothetical protein
MDNTVLVPIMILGWGPFTLFAFSAFNSRKAAAMALIFGWLFLPDYTYNLPGLPDYTKTAATCFPIMFATLIFDSGRLGKLKLNKLDIPILVWICVALVTSLSNGLGVYDGVSGMLRKIFEWGLPYAIGKMYFSDREGLRELAKWIVIGGVIYIPFCLWEMRMSATLNEHLYGFRNDRFGTTYRFGGYRPTVFLQHGIAVGFWMMSSVLMGLWLWKNNAVKYIGSFSIGLVVKVLFVVFILCRALGGIILFLLGYFAYRLIRNWGFPIIVVCMVMMPVFYISARGSGLMSTDSLVELTTKVSEDRARSLYGRLYHEEKLANKAWLRPVLGWGGWGRNRIYDEQGRDISVTDGYWVIVFGVHGLVGLVAMGLILLSPSMIFWKRYRKHSWKQPQFAPMAGFATILPLYVIDCLMNAMINPVYAVAVGGMLGWLALNDNGLPEEVESETPT